MDNNTSGNPGDLRDRYPAALAQFIAAPGDQSSSSAASVDSASVDPGNPGAPLSSGPPSFFFASPDIELLDITPLNVSDRPSVPDVTEPLNSSDLPSVPTITEARKFSDLPSIPEVTEPLNSSDLPSIPDITAPKSDAMAPRNGVEYTTDDDADETASDVTMMSLVAPQSARLPTATQATRINQILRAKPAPSSSTFVAPAAEVVTLDTIASQTAMVPTVDLTALIGQAKPALKANGKAKAKMLPAAEVVAKYPRGYAQIVTSATEFAKAVDIDTLMLYHAQAIAMRDEAAALEAHWQEKLDQATAIFTANRERLAASGAANKRRRYEERDAGGILNRAKLNAATPEKRKWLEKKGRQDKYLRELVSFCGTMAEGMYGAGGKEVQRVIDGCTRLAKAVLVCRSERARLAAGRPHKPEVVLIQCPVGVDHDLVWFLKHAGVLLEGCKLQLESTKRAFDKLGKQVLNEAESFDTSDDEDNGEADVGDENENEDENEDEEMEEEGDEEEEHEI